jgi:predicted ATPase
VIREEARQWQLQASVEDVTSRVPESLRQLIEKQLERLPLEEQRVLEAASVAGGEFSTAVIAAGIDEKVEQVEERCEELARRGQFLRPQGTVTFPDRTVTGRYSFLHALYQKVLYERLTAARRLRLHRRIGESEEALYRDRVGEVAAELALHFERGQDYGRAVQYLGEAAENALRRYAHREAIDHLTKGLELLKTLPDTPERTNQELRLQIPLGASLIATKGYAAVEVEKAYARARELCQQLGETPHIFSVLHGLYRFYLVRTELQTARELAEQMLRLAQSVQDPALLLEAHFALGNTLFFLGEFAPAQAHLEEGTALYNPQQHRVHAFRVVQDPGVACLSYAALALWFLGSPDQALKRSDKALTLARELSHPFSLAFALDLAAWLHQCCQDGQATQKRAGELVTLANEQGFPYWSAMGTTLHAWALAEQGRGEEGIAQMRQGMAAGRATGAELGQPYYLALLAAAYGKVGQAKEGLTMLAEALAAVNNSGERWWETEMYRLKGKLLLTQGDKRQRAKGKTDKEAEACFHQAVDIARRQGAKSLELRAVMSLSRLWQKQGKETQARQMLAEIYGWFTEGFDTADLQEARVLLEAMESNE